jgi:crotonobetainyl-CoA:carnitine CoA-transferase CaiB-like acyl-CoA transferase
MDRLGFGYEAVKAVHPSIIYAELSGYGNEGDWSQLPGQDLLLQSVSGLTWLSNDRDKGPTPMGVAVVDILAGTHIAQGILAALFARGQHGMGAFVQVSMFESILDYQFEVLTSYFNDGRQLPTRGRANSAHAYIAAPYGIYQTKDDYIAIAMTPIDRLGERLGSAALAQYSDPGTWFSHRDEIKRILSAHLLTETAAHWLGILEKEGVWCAPVYDYDRLVQTEGYKVLDMELRVTTGDGVSVTTTRCPIRIDGELMLSDRGAPRLGEHNAEIDRAFGIDGHVSANIQADHHP